MITYSLNRLLGADFLAISVCIFWIEGRALSSVGTMVTRPIHEETLLNYFDPNKKESKLVAKKKTEVAVTQAVPKHAGFLVCMYFVKFCQHYFKKIYIQ